VSEFGGSRKNERAACYRALTIRDGPGCFYCGCVLGCDDGDQLRTLDRWIPRKAGGGADQANLRLACKACNNAKGSTSGPVFVRSDWLAWRREQIAQHNAPVVVPEGIYTRTRRSDR
jgi:5-methylcytosine-specific restriction endonuclease McrA